MMTGGGVGEGLRGGELMAALVTGVALLGGLAAGQGILGQRTGPHARVADRRAAGRRRQPPHRVGRDAGDDGRVVRRQRRRRRRRAGAPARACPTSPAWSLFAVVMLAVVGLGLGVLSWSALVAGLATTGAGDLRPEPGLRRPRRHPVRRPGGQRPDRLPAGRGARDRLRRGVLAAHAGLHPRPRAHPPGGVVRAGRAGDPDAGLRRSPGRRSTPRPAPGTSPTSCATSGSPTIAYLFVAVGFTGSVLTNIWSGALSLADVAPRVAHRAALVAVAAAGTVLAASGFDDLMLVVAHDHGAGGAGAGRDLRHPRRPRRRRRDPDGGRSAWALGGRASRAGWRCTWQALHSRSRRRRSCRRWPTGCSARRGSGNWRTRGLGG